MQRVRVICLAYLLVRRLCSLRHLTSNAAARRVSLKESEASSHILLSGSRGVGGILSTAPSHVELDLFDLEEDEEDSEDGSDGDEEE